MVVECPAVRPGALPAVMEIPHFAATLKVGEFRAVDVARDEEYKEFPLLALPPLGTCLSPLCTFRRCRDSFDEGWWIVKIQWLTYTA